MLFRGIVMGPKSRINALSWQSAVLCFLYVWLSVGLHTNSVKEGGYRSINEHMLGLIL